jgi:hypothetical protein
MRRISADLFPVCFLQEDLQKVLVPPLKDGKMTSTKNELPSRI